MMGSDYSSKFSPWLSTGCISPHYIYKKVKNMRLNEFQIQVHTGLFSDFYGAAILNF
jgi:deoxyribodipyrimidine photolyase